MQKLNVKFEDYEALTLAEKVAQYGSLVFTAKQVNLLNALLAGDNTHEELTRTLDCTRRSVSTCAGSLNRKFEDMIEIDRLMWEDVTTYDLDESVLDEALCFDLMVWFYEVFAEDTSAVAEDTAEDTAEETAEETDEIWGSEVLTENICDLMGQVGYIKDATEIDTFVNNWCVQSDVHAKAVEVMSAVIRNYRNSL